MTKQQIEDQSRLLEACQLLGATFKDDEIRLPDGTEIAVEDFGERWTLRYEAHKIYPLKDRSALRLQRLILDLQLRILGDKILQKNLDESA